MAESEGASVSFYESVFLPFLKAVSIEIQDTTASGAGVNWCIISLHTYQRMLHATRSDHSCHFPTFLKKVVEWEPYITANAYYMKHWKTPDGNVSTDIPSYPRFLTLMRQLCRVLNVVSMTPKSYEKRKPVITLHVAIDRSTAIDAATAGMGTWHMHTIT